MDFNKPEAVANTAPATSPAHTYHEDLLHSTYNDPAHSLQPRSTILDPNFSFLAKYQLTSLPAVAIASSTLPFTSADGNDARLLPPDFQPSEFDVVCGRGKGSYNAPGCKKLRALIREYIPEYTAARTKFDKSTVLSQIVDVFQSQNNYTAKFVKKDPSGAWCEIGNDQAREKVGHTMRETIAALQSRSTATAKVAEWDVETKGNKHKAIMESYKSLRRCSKMSKLKKGRNKIAPSA
jgi:hypothetical protein